MTETTITRKGITLFLLLTITLIAIVLGANWLLQRPDEKTAAQRNAQMTIDMGGNSEGVELKSKIDVPNQQSASIGKRLIAPQQKVHSP